MSVLKNIIFISLLLPASALGCDLEDCSLPVSLHQINGEEAPDHGIWTWLHHDLALARRAARHENDARALDLAHSLDRVIRSRLDDLRKFSDPEALLDFHKALQQVVREAGGWPLAEIKLEDKEA